LALNLYRCDQANKAFLRGIQRCKDTFHGPDRFQSFCSEINLTSWRTLALKAEFNAKAQAAKRKEFLSFAPCRLCAWRLNVIATGFALVAALLPRANVILVFGAMRRCVCALRMAGAEKLSTT